MVVPTVRCTVVARALLNLGDDLPEEGNHGHDLRIATLIEESLAHGHVSTTVLGCSKSPPNRDASGVHLGWAGKGSIHLGTIRMTTPVRLSKLRGLAGVDALECTMSAAPPLSPHAELLSPEHRPYITFERAQRTEEAGSVWRCEFAYRALSRAEWEQCKGGEGARPQLTVDRQSATKLVERIAGAAPAEGSIDALTRALRRFTRRGDVAVCLVPDLSDKLDRVWSQRAAALEMDRGTRAILERLRRELGAAEEQLLQLWRGPRPMLELSRHGATEPDERPFAVACFGDNADVLRALQPGLAGRVASVYIDPPYDTGTKEFRYGDNYGAQRWLSMMDLRLRRLRDLMADSSSIHISINESRVFELKLLGDEVFGPSNYLGMTTVRVRHDDRILKGHKALHEVTDFLVGFRAGEEHRPGQRSASEKRAEYCWRLAVRGGPAQRAVRGGKDVERYEPDSFTLVKCPNEEDTEGRLKRINIRGALRESNSSGRFFTKHLHEEFTRHPGALFRVSGMGGDGLGYRDFIIPPSDSGRRNPDYLQGPPVEKRRGGGRPFPNLMNFEREFNQVHREGGVEFRNGKKPLAFLEHVLRLQDVQRSQDAVVMDCFAGSGSLACAVEALDQADGGTRCCVLVESGPWFEDVLLERLANHVSEHPRASARGYLRLRFALFEDVLDHIVWEEDLERARSQEDGGPLAALRRGLEGSYQWVDPGMSQAAHTMLVRAVSGRGVERQEIDRCRSLALMHGGDPTLVGGPTSFEQLRVSLGPKASGGSAFEDFYAAMRGEDPGESRDID